MTRAMSGPRADAGAILVWSVRTETPAVRARLPHYRSVLAADELQRAGRFLQPDDATRFIVGRMLARTMLARHADLPPREWPIRIDAHGRPVLGARPPGAPDLRFNLTHTTGIVACAIAVGREVGIDVEHMRRAVTHQVPERFFSPREVTDLRALPEADQANAFFDYWTLKEAYIKARGLGLALPLRQFTFVRHADRPPAIEFGELADDPASWQFAQFCPTPDHRLAIAIRRYGEDLRIEIEDVVPEAPA
jgi:4'-phosphopantetheinyl transferase